MVVIIRDEMGGGGGGVVRLFYETLLMKGRFSVRETRIEAYVYDFVVAFW